jgi:hypothetical protein
MCPVICCVFSSIWNTLKKLYGLTGDLSSRSRWAGDFSYMFDFNGTPRNDLPTQLPRAADVKPNDNNIMNGLQRELAQLVAKLIGSPAPGAMSETIAGQFIKKGWDIARKMMHVYEGGKKVVEAVVDGVKKTGAVIKTGATVVKNTAVQGATAVKNTVVNGANAVRNGVVNGYNTLSAGVQQLLGGSLMEIHAHVKKREASALSWDQMARLMAHAHRAAGKKGGGARASEQGVMQPDAAALLEADSDTDAEALAALRAAANSPYRGADGRLTGPDCNHPLFDMDTVRPLCTAPPPPGLVRFLADACPLFRCCALCCCVVQYLSHEPWQMPGVLSLEVEKAGLNLEQIYADT